MVYSDDDMLMLSGIQHYMFCARQWALIHIEQVWSDNRLTAEGSILHSNVDDPFYRQLNNGLLTIRGVKLASHELGLYGVADAIELLPEADINNVAITHPNYPGRWTPHLVEYKHGKPKPDERDEVQLMAQAMCLEEMYGVKVQEASLFYFETRHRLEIVLTDQLRQLTIRLANQMHELFGKGEVPLPHYQPHCKNCSLIDLCQPEIERCKSVSTYLKSNLYEETT
jgi:CRISPR-associated exonuclease Cas4